FAPFAGSDRGAHATPAVAVAAAAHASRRGVLPRRHFLRSGAYPLALARAALTPTGAAGTLAPATPEKRHAVGRTRARQSAPYAEIAAVSAPSSASRMKWLAVTTITNVIRKGYTSHSTRTAECRARRASGQPIMSANATCIEGTAA